MRKLTMQETFNKIRDHLLKQNYKSKAVFQDSVLCAFRDGNGRSCAIGCLIPDKKYRPELEYSVVHDRKIMDILETVIEMGKSLTAINFLEDCQDIHDKHDPCDWQDELGNVALAYNLAP
ncbi:hypothetical protein IIA15_00350 [candidate division TA06 bacterium]|nr:hypothetical protein [candidate division TA06 bacterium]